MRGIERKVLPTPRRNQGLSPLPPSFPANPTPPNPTQDTLAWESPRSNRGYVRIGRERVTQSADAAEIAKMRESAPDYKESMEIGREADAEWKNMWPKESEAPEFRGTMLGFFQVRIPPDWMSWGEDLRLMRLIGV